ncbi:hypothetical protein ELI_1641 [Eubacterium callanderi]|uniref:Uncharacterized protein n=1 Tax=Eubacterium callanderi TaxID=53442 RepID=E3GLK3_9FIRM|nr:hypothetical protein ELI_1641 [Eubacterium callanderi]
MYFDRPQNACLCGFWPFLITHGLTSENCVMKKGFPIIHFSLSIFN